MPSMGPYDTLNGSLGGRLGLTPSAYVLTGAAPGESVGARITGARFTVAVRVWPSRTKVIVAVGESAVPGFAVRTSATRSPYDLTATPFIDVIKSPFCRPACFAGAAAGSHVV